MVSHGTSLLMSLAICWFGLFGVVQGATFHRWYARVVASAVACIPLGSFADSGSVYIQQGMQMFSHGNIAESVRLFDEAEHIDNKYSKYLWQRGISYYYNNEFDKAKAQFEVDAKISPGDTEERLWAYLSNSRLIISRHEENNIMARPVSDRRDYMNAIYEAYHDGKDIAIDPSDNVNRGINYFYLNLYAGLLEEARGNPTKSLHYIRNAVTSMYAKTSRDYMVDVARIHLKLRSNI